MLKYIVEKKSIFPKIAEEVKKSKLPLLFYILYYSKNSIIEKNMFSIISEYGINIEKYVIDSERLEENEKFFGNEVYALEEVLKNYKKVNVFVAFACDDVQIRKKLLDNKNVENVFIYDGGHNCSCEKLNSYNFTYDFIAENEKNFQYLYDNLNDELSKKTLCAFLNQRISGDYKYLRPVHNSYDLQYFSPEIIKLRSDEVFVDCGAYDGNTICKFLKHIELNSKDFKKIYAFEPDKANYLKLLSNFGDNKKIKFLNTGLWNENVKLNFTSNGPASFVSNSGENCIEVDSIDNVINEQITFIKMDIEGVESRALLGAENSIKKYKPKLAISVYHNYDDLIMIPKQIKKMVPEYRLYLRAYRHYALELVLYAIIE